MNGAIESGRRAALEVAVMAGLEITGPFGLSVDPINYLSEL